MSNLMKPKFIQAYMEVAKTFANLSSAKRLQVGAIVVKDDRIISIGYNGTPTGWDNCCEELALDVVGVAKDGKDIVEPYLKTKPEVLHAEMNAIAKLARSPESGEGASIFITHAPCIDCAKLIYQSGIKTVYYRTEYRSIDGIKFLEKCGLHIEKI
jgi:dCMP deaminase